MSARVQDGSYNAAVSPTGPSEPPPERRSPENSRDGEPPKANIYTLEAAGILIIGAPVLIVTRVRCWHQIAWGAR